MTTKQKLAYSICQFLNSSQDLSPEEKESLEVAVQCISDVFKIDVEDRSLSVDTPLPLIFDVFLKTKEQQAASKPKSTVDSTTSPTSPKTPSAADIAQSETAKSLGNKAMAEKDYSSAISHYTTAISLNPTSPIYFSNRAAAYSQLSQHEDAIRDAETALKLDVKFVKGYSRLGHALFSLGRYEDAVACYEKGVKLDPTNDSLKQALNVAKSKVTTSSSASSSTASDEPTSRSASGGAGGLPNLGGIDVASMMNNPDIMGMMNNPNLAAMMQNPQVAQMAQNLMRDPQALQNLMSTFGGLGGNNGNR